MVVVCFQGRAERPFYVPSTELLDLGFGEKMNVEIALQNAKCSICGSANCVTKRFQSTRLLYCEDCDVHANADRMSLLETDHYYKYTYFMGEFNEIANIERMRHFRYPERVWLINVIQATKPAPADLLDIGCDKGFFIDDARRYGYNVRGVEPSERARAYCEKIGLSVVESIDEVSGNYDVVTMQHSLEHFSQPLIGLTAAYNCLRPGGIIIVRVPDFSSRWRKLRGEKWVWFQPQNHYFHYSKKSLGIILRKAGFDVTSIASQRPNDALTVRSNLLAGSVFKGKAAAETFRSRLARVLEDITGVELFAMARRP